MFDGQPAERSESEVRSLRDLVFGRSAADPSRNTASGLFVLTDPDGKWITATYDPRELTMWVRGGWNRGADQHIWVGYQARLPWPVDDPEPPTARLRYPEGQLPPVSARLGPIDDPDLDSLAMQGTPEAFLRAHRRFSPKAASALPSDVEARALWLGPQGQAFLRDRHGIRVGSFGPNGFSDVTQGAAPATDVIDFASLVGTAASNPGVAGHMKQVLDASSLEAFQAACTGLQRRLTPGVDLGANISPELTHLLADNFGLRPSGLPGGLPAGRADDTGPVPEETAPTTDASPNQRVGYHDRVAALAKRATASIGDNQQAVVIGGAIAILGVGAVWLKRRRQRKANEKAQREANEKAQREERESTA